MKIGLSLVSLFTLLFFLSCGQKNIEVDILINNGTVYNGMDSVPKKISIGITKDRISYIGDRQGNNFKAKKTIDATGLIVCPGFIDPHTHADKDLLDRETSHNLPFLMQGVTTVTVGSDGNSIFPLKDYKKKCSEHGIGTNVVPLTGHGTIRKYAMGESDRDPTEQELDSMRNVVQAEMRDGAFGMSTGLFYKPGSYSKTGEVIELAKIVSKNNGIYDTHLRDESTFSIGLVPAVEEAITIGEKANVPVHISHIKCLGVDVWNQSNSIIELIENNREKGLNITANQYPYEASATSLQAAVVPRWAESGGKDSLFIRYRRPSVKDRILGDTKKNIGRRGGPDKLLIVKAEDTTLIGKTLLQISKEMNVSPQEAVFKMLKTNSPKVASFNMNKDDIVNFMKQDWVVTGSDGGSGHPRKYGSFPRKYRKYVIADSVISLHRFINNSSKKTAEILQLPERGELKEGYYADVIIFDPKAYRDKADYTNAFEYAEGVRYSIVNGNLAIDDGAYTQLLSGRFLDK